MSIFIRTVPNVMAHFGCSAETAQRYIDLRDEGHGTEQAALMAGLSDPHEDAPTRKQYRIEADWEGGGFAYTLSFDSREQAVQWAEGKAAGHRGAVVTVKERESNLELARRFGFGGLSEADLDPRNYHLALEKQVNRPDELTIACTGGRS